MAKKNKYQRSVDRRNRNKLLSWAPFILLGIIAAPFMLAFECVRNWLFCQHDILAHRDHEGNFHGHFCTKCSWRGLDLKTGDL